MLQLTIPLRQLHSAPRPGRQWSASEFPRRPSQPAWVATFYQLRQHRLCSLTPLFLLGFYTFLCWLFSSRTNDPVSTIMSLAHVSYLSFLFTDFYHRSLAAVVQIKQLCYIRAGPWILGMQGISHTQTQKLIAGATGRALHISDKSKSPV